MAVDQSYTNIPLEYPGGPRKRLVQEGIVTVDLPITETLSPSAPLPQPPLVSSGTWAQTATEALKKVRRFMDSRADDDRFLKRSEYDKLRRVPLSERALKLLGAVLLIAVAILASLAFCYSRLFRVIEYEVPFNDTLGRLIYYGEVSKHVVLPKYGGFLVENVLDPTRPLDTLDSVKILLQKIRNSPLARIQNVEVETFTKGYVPYTYVEDGSDAVGVNSTVEGLADAMTPAEKIYCEGALHYGIERNIVVVYKWTPVQPVTLGEEAGKQLLFNPKVSERDAEPTKRRNSLIDDQENCRIVSLINKQDGEAVATPTTESFVSETATIEYLTESGLKKRRRIYQPLLACVDHVFKLGGLSDV